MKAVILCAGYGERAKPLTDYLPKPLFPILGEPLLTHIIYQLKKIGVNEICINIHHLAEKIRDYLTNNNFDIKFNIFYEKEILGVGGGIANMRPFLIKEPFFIVHNGDILSNIDIKPVIDYHMKKKAFATLILHKYPQFNNVSVIQNNITHIGRGDFAFTGISIMSNKIFEFLPSGSSMNIIDAYRELIKLKKLKAYISYNHFWQDIGDIKRYIDLHKSILIDKINVLKNRQLPKSSIYIGDNSRVSKSAKLNGFVSIGKNCIIEDNTYIENCVIWDNVIIKKNVSVRDEVVYENRRNS